MDGSGSLLRALGVPDHRHSAGFEILRRLFPELLCPAVPANLAALLFRVDRNVCDSPATAPSGYSGTFSASLALVVVPALLAEFSRTRACAGCWAPRGVVVAGGGRIVLSGVAVFCEISFEGEIAARGMGRAAGVAGASAVLSYAPLDHLLKSVLPPGRNDGGSAARGPGAKNRVRAGPAS